ncbi:hypothetical protein BDB01DRAFT_852021 [Pilobolus umbonatus]|nr:hypothetical protein BDB01DRAFT_852021 [Pilobolus umbonatus]
MLVKNKVAIVLGGTSGIGKEIVFTLISKGAYVVFSGTKKEKGDSTMKQLNSTFNERPLQAFFYCANVTDWAAQKEIYKFTEKKFQLKVDIVIIVAGILDSSSLLDDHEQGSFLTFDINLTAAVKANRLAIQYYLKNKRPGCIINTSSIYGLTNAPLGPLYSASKHAIIGLTKSYGNLFRSTNIRINAVAPDFVETPLIRKESLDLLSPFGMVSMKDCVDAYLYAIEDESLNGDIITVSSKGRQIEPRYSNPHYEQLDKLCAAKKERILKDIIDHFTSDE